MNNKIYIASIVSVIITSCVVHTPVQFVKPVDINENDVRSLQNIVLLNRTAVPKESNAENVFEGIITGEMVGADKRGAEVCLRGISQGLSESLNYKAIVNIPQVFYGAKNRGFPDPLPWKIIDSLCKQYNSQALVALEFFDSNGGLSMGITNPTVPLNYGGYTNNVSVQTFWRFYNSENHIVIDAYDFKTVSNSGGYKSNCIPYNVLSKYNSTKDAGFWAGMEYAYRISEQFITETRICFRGGNPEMRKACRLALAGDWQTASTIWNNEADRSSKRKIRARALNNLAVYQERQGNLDEAIRLATQSVGEKGYSSTYALINRLKTRVADQQRLISGKQ